MTVFDDLLVNHETKHQLELFAASPSHALLLVAPAGSGKRSLAEALAKQLLGLPLEQIATEAPAIIYIQPEKNIISIQTIRDLQTELQLKTIGANKIRRIVLIESANRMTTEAQNALLKVLEEPSTDTVFIMTAPSINSVLPTIYSRVQHIEIKPMPQEELNKFLQARHYQPGDIQRASHYGGGLIGLTMAILSSDDEHPLLSAVNEARNVLSVPIFERLTMVDGWSNNRDALPSKLEVLMRICQAGVTQAAKSNNLNLTKRWRKMYRATYNANQLLSKNANLKLLLTNLFLDLG